MHSFRDLVAQFEQQFGKRQFPETPSTLYDPAQYILSLGGKRIRPVLAIMGNELFDNIHPDAFLAGNAIEVFHNFTLVHDDIMDKAPLRRGMATVHIKYNEPTAILAGDVMLIHTYDYLNKIQSKQKQKIISVFNKAATEVCEGQQLDMDMEAMAPDQVNYADYVNMIALKTSVLLAASLQMGAIIGGASEGNQGHIYGFGKNVGIAFQIQDDLLDAFGNPDKVGKQQGGDILINKKTFLLLKAIELCTPAQRQQMDKLMALGADDATKVPQTLELFRDCKVDEWAEQQKKHFMELAFGHLEDIAVMNSRKAPLLELADYLLTRQY